MARSSSSSSKLESAYVTGCWLLSVNFEIHPVTQFAYIGCLDMAIEWVIIGVRSMEMGGT